MHTHRFPSFFIQLLAVSVFAAEPTVKPDDLPRVPPTSPEKGAATCAVHPGFHLQLMAAEPLVMDPVALAFDENGRLFVVEMRDYSERREEKLGRVKLLEDRDGDGRFDHASVFAENLPWPTGIACWDGGVFVLAAPDLWYFKDTDGDGKADVHALIFTGFGNLAEKLNVQALPNSLQWGPDQRIHGALGGNPSRVDNFARFGSPKIELRGRDFSFDPRKMDLQPESGGGQFGMSFDDTGRKFVCSNSRHLMQVMYEDRVAAQVQDYPLPAAAVDIAADGPQAEVFRRSPEEPWRVIRTKWRVDGQVKGPVEGGGRSSGYFTGATGVTIYRGDVWPAEYRGDVFVADCGSNLVHHKKFSGDLLRRGARAPGEEHSEFVASTDNWFRPVAFANAPDGCLWIIDMYREVIEHPWSLPESLKQHLDLNSGNDRGRLYRLVPDGATLRRTWNLKNCSSAELVALLEHPNGWHRDTAARLLHERQDPAAEFAVANLVEKSKVASSRLLALHVLRGLNGHDAAILERGLRDTDADVRAGAVRLGALTDAFPGLILTLADDSSARVRAEVGWAFVTLPAAEKVDALVTLLDRADEPWLRHSALAGAGDALQAALEKLGAKNPARVAELRRLLGAGKTPAPSPIVTGPAGPRAEAVARFQPALTLHGNAEKGRAIFAARCAICHRFAGSGQSVGPDLDAAHSGGREKVLGNILEPSREITAGYALGLVETTTGESVSGLLANETPAGVTLRLPGGGERVVRRRDIAKVERPTRSLMPDGLEGGLTPQDMADLLEFLAPNAAASPRDNLLFYRDDNGTPQPVRTPDEWKKRRAQILVAAQEIMGPLPGPEKKCPLDVKVTEETDCGTYVRRLLTYASEPGNRVPAYLLIPKGALQPESRAPAVLCLHPTDDTIGHKVVVGLGGKANRAYAAELAERGFVTISPSYPLLANYQPDLTALGYVSGTMKAIHDNRRALDLLDSLPFVRTGKYGAIGHSLGGHNAVFTAVFDERLEVIVSSCGLDSFRDYKGGDIRGWTSVRYMPRLLAWRDRLSEVPFDFGELIACLAPRTVFLSAPLHDDNFRTDSVDYVAASASPIFELLDDARCLIVEHPDAAHDFPDAMREKAYELLAEKLGKP
jgi:putative membrane-bound dehydrogenase-like protein